MATTSFSLLERLRTQADADAWERLVGVYTPVLRHWLNRQGLQAADADDLLQDVLAVLARELPKFEHNRRTGAFRRWLKTILANRLRGFFRTRPAKASEAPSFARLADQLEDPASAQSEQWEREHDRHVLARLLTQIEPQVTPPTWQAFRRTVLDGQDEETVARDLQMSVNAVFIAKSRVLARLRREAKGLVD